MNSHDLVTTSALMSPSRVHEPLSWVGHIPFALWLVEQHKPQTLVELGTHTGNSYFALCQSVLSNNLPTHCYAVDTWQGDVHAGQYGDDVYRSVTQYNDSHYSTFSHLLRMTFDEAAPQFSDGAIDFLHIDGLHTYEAVRHDFETWLPKLSDRAVVLFHDTNVRERGFGVWQLWEELSARYPSIHFDHSHGLGVLFVGKEQPLAVHEILKRWATPEARDIAHQFFAKLGQCVEFEWRITSHNQVVAELNGQIANLKQDVTERDGQIVNLNRAVAVFETSTSWRVTRPLRWLGDQLKRAKRIVALLPAALRRGGGLQGTITKIIQLYQREGYAGIKRGLQIVQTAGEISPILGSDGFDRNDYTEWVRRYDTLTDETRAMLLARTASLGQKPLISVVMPVYNPKPEWLIEAIGSVSKQIYPYWELCIADDASTDKAIRPILESYARADKRIKVVFRAQNGHISAASNSALELATGVWVALLDHDDLLSEHALFWVADAINQDPEARLIYSDEDKIDDVGRRLAPYFKCDWNADLFYSHNLITHLSGYHTALLREIGGFREGLEGAQDYDLALRCIERIETKQIHHIPRVLYHWRMHVESTAHSGDAKPYAMLAGERALNEHFQRRGVNAIASLLDFGMYRIRYSLPNTLPLVSLIIPTRNGLQLIQQCVESILKKTTYPNYEILIVDNGSDDPATLQYFNQLQAEARVRVVRDDRPFNYSALNNAAVKLARGELVGLINNDIEVISPDWLSEMVSHALRPGVGAVGAKLWYPNNTLQHGGAVLGVGGVTGHSHKHLGHQQYGYFGRASLIQSFSAVTAACLVIRKTIFEEVGGLNEMELQIAFNDIDFCLRVREAGYRNIWTPYAELYHHESASRGAEDTTKKRERFAKEVRYMKQHWGEQLLNDPAYSPNLTLDHEDFSLAWPPRVELFAASVQGEQQSQLNRIDKALIMVDRKGLGLEIGPSHNPLTPKKEGFNVHILDHASAEELREKYKGHGVNLGNIEEVDFVWHGEPLHELVGREQCYDWIIASHVIEHTPDLITFLVECERLLKSDGVLSLIIPDKRYCFDYYNAPTSTGELLDAFEQKRKRPSPGKVFDHFVGATTRNGNIAWSAAHDGPIEFVHTFVEAQAHWGRARSTTDYIDVHNWRFTPASFRLLLNDLQVLGLTELGIKTEFDTVGCEFYVTLGKSKSVLAMNRLLALEKVLDEAYRG